MYRFHSLLLKIAEDPEISLGDYLEGGTRCSMPLLPSLYKKKKWRIAAHAGPLDYLGEHQQTVSARRRLTSLTDEVLEVPHDQSQRGQVLQMSK